MKASLSWLRCHVDISTDVNQLAEALTMAGLEVEGIENRFAYLSKIVAGRITAITPHPRAQRLNCCTVDIGAQPLAIVCGAPNAEVGGIAPVALPGTLLPSGAVIQKSVIRGERSTGMLLSEFELGIGPAADGLLLLPADTTPGAPLSVLYPEDDPVLDISITPNRPDCLSIRGVARDIAALTGVALKPVALPSAMPFGPAIHDRTQVTVERPDLCPRYAARLLTAVQVAPSPFWLKDRLQSVGVRPINNVVDITNFIMLETGQPLHAFDFDRLAGGRIVVRTAAPGETFITLDQKSRILSADTLMICDAEKPVAVAGVMGGLNSEIEAGTQQVLLESAYFAPHSIRRTAKTLGLATDASYRFERGIDPLGTVIALERAAALMRDICSATPIDGVIDVFPVPHVVAPIRLETARVHRLLGVAIATADIRRHLTAIECTVTDAGPPDQLDVIAPSFRVDISRPEDLVEEVARLHGYEAIPVTFPAIPTSPRPLNRLMQLRQKITDVMTRFGFLEAITYSFIQGDWPDRLRLPDDDPRRRMVMIRNPISEDQAVMRTTLVPGLLATWAHNVFQQNGDIQLFESGKVFFAHPEDHLPDEVEMVAALISGAAAPAAWHGKERPCDCFDLKGALESLFEALRLPAPVFTATPLERCCYTRPGASADIECAGQATGIIGELSPRVAATVGIKQRAFIFELELPLLATAGERQRPIRNITRYPAVNRDITLIVAAATPVGEILSAFDGIGESLIETVNLFDLYTGPPIASGKKSVSFRVRYRSPDATLEDEAVNQLHQRMTHMLCHRFKADLPA